MDSDYWKRRIHKEFSQRDIGSASNYKRMINLTSLSRFSKKYKPVRLVQSNSLERYNDIKTHLAASLVFYQSLEDAWNTHFSNTITHIELSNRFRIGEKRDVLQLYNLVRDWDPESKRDLECDYRIREMISKEKDTKEALHVLTHAIRLFLTIKTRGQYGYYCNYSPVVNRSMTEHIKLFRTFLC